MFFIRKKDGIAVNDKMFAEESGLEEKTNDNRLFLSLCAQLGGSISKQVIAWFQQDLQILSGLNNQKYSNITKNSFFENKDICKRIICFFDKLQLGFNSIETIESEDSPESNRLSEQYIQYISKVNNRRNIELESTHNIYNKRGEICGSINFPFDERESAGTKKLFDIAGPVFEALDNGKTLVVDELDAKMHPLISQYIIDLFNNPKTNPYNAQLIFTTHDTHLLSLKLLRRDQIWFTEKDAKEQTGLYCLMDIVLPDGSKPRNDSNYERNYISGRYGAIPYIVND